MYAALQQYARLGLGMYAALQQCARLRREDKTHAEGQASRRGDHLDGSIAHWQLACFDGQPGRNLLGKSSEYEAEGHAQDHAMNE
jgi:hypothetical protein